jgi:hypothetical protein
VHVGPIETPHGSDALKYELKPPPPTGKVREWLAKLGDLPKQAEEEAHTFSEFKKKIKDLERELRTRPTRDVAAPAAPAVPDKRAIDRAIAETARAFGKQVTGLEATVQRLRRYLTKTAGECAELALIKLPEAPNMPVVTAIAAPGPRAPSPARTAYPVARKPLEPSGNGDHGATELPPGELAVLKAAAQYPEGVERKQASILTGYKRSSRDTYANRLSVRGFVTFSGSKIIATQEGVDALGSGFEPLPEGPELRDYWLGRLPEGERRVFEILVAAEGKNVPRGTIDEVTNYKRSSRDTYLNRLMARKIVEPAGRGEVRAAKELF